ncbi:hypothetical protein FIBSPDRAFT_946804 [Athelia psychrophila]|uniref:Uncharacterized protein n=1 Tax=Athelia psychrophila TaxID=1759441 RepID=A0A166SJZ8_9AGAM|nr:hypothetical protein FIBSPDRAFT_946804 [Fibularhizoctonia sp. CBS 109695]
MFRPVTPRQQRVIGNTRAHKRDSKLYTRGPSNVDGTDDSSVVHLLWPQAPASLEIEPFFVKVEEKDLMMDVDVKDVMMDVDVKKEAAQLEEEAHVTREPFVNEEVL